jgi:hypothetical protein
MQYSKSLICVALTAVAATATGIACTESKEAAETRAQAAQAVVPGNNGTVKIQEAGSTDEIPDNDPHVGCRFEIEFRNFDEGALDATWTLSGQPPSGQDVIATENVFIGEDPAGGAPDLDAVAVVDLTQYDLSALEVHPQQGIHLKLEVHAEGSIGADTKFKTFWVQGCVPTPDGGGSSSGGSSSGGSSSGGSSSGQTW